MAPHSKSSASPAPKKTIGLQVKPKAAKLEASVSWYGGEDTNQDVSLSLVRDDHTVAKLMVHDSRLKTCSRYFEAGASDNWNPAKRKPESLYPKKLTFHVDGNVRMYIDCFSRMYSPLTVGFGTVLYSLQLLAVATHLACDDLMSSICRYLAVRPWADDDEMRIRSAVSSEDFPRGHAKDLLRRLEMRQSAEELRPLIKMCMNSARSSRAAKELLSHVLRIARVQEQNPIPTFEQEVVSMINDEFKLSLVEAERRNIAASNRGGLTRSFLNIEPKIHGVLHVLIETDMADEGVRWFFGYHPFLSLPQVQGRMPSNVVVAVTVIARIYVGMVRDLVARSGLFIPATTESVRDMMLINLLPLLDWLYKNGNRVFGGMGIFRVEFENFIRILPSNAPYSKELQEIINRVRLAP